MAIVQALLAILFWAFALVTFLYRWLYLGGQFWVVVGEFNKAVHPLKLIGRAPAPFAQRVIAILQRKYDRRGPRMFGKKLL